jgi:hypothetical protein
LSPPFREGGNPLPRATFRALAERAIAAARRVRIDPEDEAWARSVLTPAEFDLWIRQSDYDRSHSVRVSRRVQDRLAGTPYAGDALWPGAALMHDVGKLQSDLSLGERAIATLASKVVKAAAARRWAGFATGTKRRIGLYLIHGEVGAKMIRAAGGREEIAAWTEVHQGDRDVGRPGLPAVVVEALIESDVA